MHFSRTSYYLTFIFIMTSSVFVHADPYTEEEQNTIASFNIDMAISKISEGRANCHLKDGKCAPLMDW